MSGIQAGMKLPQGMRVELKVYMTAGYPEHPMAVSTLGNLEALPEANEVGAAEARDAMIEMTKQGMPFLPDVDKMRPATDEEIEAYLKAEEEEEGSFETDLDQDAFDYTEHAPDHYWD